MIEALAAAVVSALVAGSGDAVKTVTSDAYNALKGLLLRLAPSFDPEIMDSQVAEAKENELGEQLAGISEDDLYSLSKAAADFAETTGERDLAENLREYAKYINIENTEAKKRVSLKLRTRANERLKVNIKSVTADDDIIIELDSIQS